MGTCNHLIVKKIPTDTLNTNMKNNQDTRKGRSHTQYKHHKNNNHCHRHPFYDHGRDVGGQGVVKGG